MTTTLSAPHPTTHPPITPNALNHPTTVSPPVAATALPTHHPRRGDSSGNSLPCQSNAFAALPPAVDNYLSTLRRQNNEALTRADFEDQTPSVLVESPLEQDQAVLEVVAVGRQVQRRVEAQLAQAQFTDADALATTVDEGFGPVSVDVPVGRWAEAVELARDGLD